MGILKLSLCNAACSANPIVRQRALTRIAKQGEKYFRVDMCPGWGAASDDLFGKKAFLARYAKQHGVSISVSENYDGKGNKFLWTVVKGRRKKVEQNIPADINATYKKVVKGLKNVDGGDTQIVVDAEQYEQDWLRQFYDILSGMVADVNPRSFRKK